MKLRKYSNRKLYDTEASKYVNLDEVISHIQQGGTVTVETTSGESCTNVVLKWALLKVDISNEAIVSILRGSNEG